MQDAAAAGRSAQQHFERLNPLYKRIESKARSLKIPVRRGDTLILAGASTPARAAARILYTGYLAAGRRAWLLDPVEAARLMLPYLEDYEVNVIVYAWGLKDARALAAVETAGILGSRITLVSAEMHPAYEEYADRAGVERVLLPGEAPATEAMIASLNSLPELPGIREERMRSEVEQAPLALEWAYERYGDIVDTAMSIKPETVLYSPAAEPGALTYCYNEKCRTLPLEDLTMLGRGSQAMILVTSVEESDYRDVMVQARIRGVKTIPISINTDPITAGFYAHLITSLITGRLI